MNNERSSTRLVENCSVSIATQAFGRPSDPAILLIMGATASMLGWPDELCSTLARHGFFVIRFDHRDTGESTTVPPGEAAYAVEDMADDIITILDAFGLGKAHLIGMSLGGYIAQMVVVEHPERVASLTLIGSEPLGWDGEQLPPISDGFLDHFGRLGTLDWSDREAVTDFLLESERLCAGTGTRFDRARKRARIEQVLSRTGSPASMFNHGALATRKDWTGRFREIACPVLVIHGEMDPILPVENGRALAAGIAGASIFTLPLVGHEIPLLKIPTIADRITAHAGSRML